MFYQKGEKALDTSHNNVVRLHSEALFHADITKIMSFIESECFKIVSMFVTAGSNRLRHEQKAQFCLYLNRRFCSLPSYMPIVQCLYNYVNSPGSEDSTLKS